MLSNVKPILLLVTVIVLGATGYSFQRTQSYQAAERDVRCRQELTNPLETFHTSADCITWRKAGGNQLPAQG